LLVITEDVLQPKMAGPAIRAYQMALALSREHDVELATTKTASIAAAEFSIIEARGRSLRAAVRRSDVVLMQGVSIEHAYHVRRYGALLVSDLYDPFHLEALEQTRDMDTESTRRLSVRRTMEALNAHLASGDYFLCASDKQRDFWLGQLARADRVNPATYDDDHTLGSLVGVVPFGLSAEPPQHTRQVLKGVVPGIGADDKVVIWGGGIYNWFDPLTLLRAVDNLRRRVPEVRLYFLGLSHPNPTVPTMRMATDAITLAAELGLTGSHVFFNEGWVDYDDRQNFLLEADVGVSTHLDTIETAFSFRTRILDYLWASLPIVATDGDSFAPIIETCGLGVTVPPGDVDALEEALYRFLTDDEARASASAAIAATADAFRWENVLAPLLEFCRVPAPAPDRAGRTARFRTSGPVLRRLWNIPGVMRIFVVLGDQLRHREFSAIVEKTTRRLGVMRKNLWYRALHKGRRRPV